MLLTMCFSRARLAEGHAVTDEQISVLLVLAVARKAASEAPVDFAGWAENVLTCSGNVAEAAVRTN